MVFPNHTPKRLAFFTFTFYVCLVDQLVLGPSLILKKQNFPALFWNVDIYTGFVGITMLN